MVDLGEVSRPEIEFETEFGQGVGKPRPGQRMEALRAVRPLRLQVDHDIVTVGEGAHRLLVRGAQRRQDAEDQRRTVFADGDFDLRQTVGDAQPADQLAQGHEQLGNVRRQDQAAMDVGDVAAAPFVETDQHAAT
ncbi:hypothetical protein SDC9_209183 [bioreactor metagenome]|uniref:Uncharacterized protein n=1 Tax=bioreactor metagenome TaxID=1076179 RepID=A0A645JDB0_9ZZZZ